MHAPTLLLLALTTLSLSAPTLLLLNTDTLTVTPTAEGGASPAEPAASSTVKPAAPGGGSNSTSSPKAGGGSNSTAAGGACTSAQIALAAGIQSNIDDQNNELATVTALGNVLSQNPLDSTLYSATQSSLLGFVTKGITIRQNNQKIAPANSPALPGLATVAMAQMTELNLTMSLAVPSSGQIDVKAASASVEALKGDFAGGIVQNMKNMAAALSNCTAPAASKAKTA